jgi:hypothetical protein
LWPSHQYATVLRAGPGPDSREGAGVGQDNTSLGVRDLALVLGRDDSVYQEIEGVYVSQTWVSRLWRENGGIESFVAHDHLEIEIYR